MLIILLHTLADEYNATVSENAEVGSQFTRVTASDADSGSLGEVTYSIIAGNEVMEDALIS